MEFALPRQPGLTSSAPASICNGSLPSPRPSVSSELMRLDSLGIFPLAERTESEADLIERAASALSARKWIMENVRQIGRRSGKLEEIYGFVDFAGNAEKVYRHIEKKYHCNLRWVPVLAGRMVRDGDLAGIAGTFTSRDSRCSVPYIVLNARDGGSLNALRHELTHIPRVLSGMSNPAISYPALSAYEEQFAECSGPGGAIRGFLRNLSLAQGDSLSALRDYVKAKRALSQQFGAFADYILIRVGHDVAHDLLAESRIIRTPSDLIRKRSDKGDLRYQIIEAKLWDSGIRLGSGA